MIDELIETLEWMLKDMEGKCEFGGPSPEFEKATLLLEKLRQYRGGEIITEETREQAVGLLVIFESRLEQS